MTSIQQEPGDMMPKIQMTAEAEGPVLLKRALEDMGVEQEAEDTRVKKKRVAVDEANEVENEKISKIETAAETAAEVPDSEPVHNNPGKCIDHEESPVNAAEPGQGQTSAHGSESAGYNQDDSITSIRSANQDQEDVASNGLDENDYDDHGNLIETAPSKIKLSPYTRVPIIKPRKQDSHPSKAFIRKFGKFNPDQLPADFEKAEGEKVLHQGLKSHIFCHASLFPACETWISELELLSFGGLIPIEVQVDSNGTYLFFGSPAKTQHAKKYVDTMKFKGFPFVGAFTYLGYNPSKQSRFAASLGRKNGGHKKTKSQFKTR